MDIKINSNFPFSVTAIQFAPNGGLSITLSTPEGQPSESRFQYTASLGDGFAEERSPVSLAQYAMDFAERCNIKQKTRLSYYTMVMHLREYGDVDIDQITTSYLQGFIEHLRRRGLKPGSVRLDFQKLSCVLRDAYKNGLFDDRILQSVNRPKKEQGKKCFLTESELKRMERTTLPERYRRIREMFMFSCMTGMRFSDIQELEWKDIKSTGRHLWIEFRQKKTGTMERIPLGSAAETMLRRMTREGKRVFGHVSNQWANAVIKKWCKKAKIKKHVTFHIARHTFCVMLLTKDVPIYTVQKLMCHSDIGTTNIYADLTSKSKAKAVRKLPSFVA